MSQPPTDLLSLTRARTGGSKGAAGRAGRSSGLASGIPKGPAINGFKAAVAVVKASRSQVDDPGQKITHQERHLLSASTNKAEDDMTALSIVATQLHYMSFEELKSLSVCSIHVAETMGHGTPGDKRLGCIDDDGLCETCYKTNMECPGHIGLIELARWFIFPQAMKCVIWTLQITCNGCGWLLITPEIAINQGLMNLRDTARLKKMADTCVGLKCRRSSDLAAYETSLADAAMAAATKIAQAFYDASIMREGPAKDAAMKNAQGLEDVTPRAQLLQEVEYRRKKAEEADASACAPNCEYSPGSADESYNIKYKYKDADNGKIDSIRKIEEIDEIFKQLSKESLAILGFENGSHPCNFIIKGFPVIPPAARPHLIQDGEIKSDHLTSSYMEIIRSNDNYSKISDVDPDAENKRARISHDLYFFISHFINNSDGKYERAAGELVKSVVERITQKDGYIRGYGMGKRNDYSGRSVLGPDSTLKFGYVAYPERMRKVLTTPEIVTIRNLDRINGLYADGKITHLTPGTGKLNGQRFQINEKTRGRYHPQIGDTADRWGEDGDETLFNRQPTLHKQSMMGYKAKYTPKETIGLHSSYTTPHNADFDGDEGNKHKLQTLMARAEARHIADVGSCIMNAQANRPMMGLVFNSISSVYMMSQPNVMIDDEDWASAMKKLSDDRSTATLRERLAKHNIPANCGKALFSTLLPPDFYYNSGAVKIRDGILTAGILTKKHVGPSAGSIIHYIWKIYGKQTTCRFFTEGQYICDWFIEWRGLSIGYSSCVAPNAKQVNDLIDSEMISTQLKIDAIGPERKDMTPMEKEYREKQIQSFLNNLTSIGRRIGLEALDPMNPLNIMSQSGSKGNEINTAQITGLLGQQFIKGRRPTMSLSGGTRCIPYFEPGSVEIEARGFIRESFMKGIKPSGMYFHMSASRIGLIDTAIKTADTGHMHHRINKVLEDVVIFYDGSVRNVKGTIFQYAYADGFDAGELIPTTSSATGDVVSFIDVKNIAGKLNLEHGFDTY